MDTFSRHPVYQKVSILWFRARLVSNVLKTWSPYPQQVSLVGCVMMTGPNPICTHMLHIYHTCLWPDPQLMCRVFFSFFEPCCHASMEALLRYQPCFKLSTIHGKPCQKGSSMFPVLGSPTASCVCGGTVVCSGLVGSVHVWQVQLYTWSILTSCNIHGQPAAGYHCDEDVLVSRFQTHAGVLLIFLNGAMSGSNVGIRKTTKTSRICIG